MKVLNEKFANEMKKINLKYDYGLTDRDCECYSNIFNVLYEISDKQLDFYQIFDVYDFFTDVLAGKKPEIDLFTNEEAFKGFYRLSKRYSTTKNLTEKQRIYFCFALYWSTCSVLNTDNELVLNFECFENGTNSIIEEYDFQLKNNPEKFEIKTYSNPELSNYGLSPDNPIEVTAVSVAYQYLDDIETDEGKEIVYNRIGTVDGPDGIIVDEYVIFEKDDQKKGNIGFIYITAFGSYNSLHTPKGFRFKE